MWTNTEGKRTLTLTGEEKHAMATIGSHATHHPTAVDAWAEEMSWFRESLIVYIRAEGTFERQWADT